MTSTSYGLPLNQSNLWSFPNPLALHHVTIGEIYPLIQLRNIPPAPSWEPIPLICWETTPCQSREASLLTHTLGHSFTSLDAYPCPRLGHLRVNTHNSSHTHLDPMSMGHACLLLRTSSRLPPHLTHHCHHRLRVHPGPTWATTTSPLLTCLFSTQDGTNPDATTEITNVPNTKCIFALVHRTTLASHPLEPAPIDPTRIIRTSHPQVTLACCHRVSSTCSSSITSGYTQAPGPHHYVNTIDNAM